LPKGESPKNVSVENLPAVLKMVLVELGLAVASGPMEDVHDLFSGHPGHALTTEPLEISDLLPVALHPVS
jgi:hypothetical protein